MKNIPLWQKLFGFYVYFFPLTETLRVGSRILDIFPALQYLYLPCLPIITIKKILPLSDLILFILIFILIIRNQNIDFSCRFNSLQAILLGIMLNLFTYGFSIIILPLGISLITSNIQDMIFITSVAFIIFCLIETVQNKLPEIPFISDAVKMQIY